MSKGHLMFLNILKHYKSSPADYMRKCSTGSRICLQEACIIPPAALTYLKECSLRLDDKTSVRFRSLYKQIGRTIRGVSTCVQSSISFLVLRFQPAGAERERK